MNKKNWSYSFIIILFALMCVLNFFTPLLADDYFAAFVWSEGVRLNGLVTENAQKISGFTDIYETIKNYYFAWGGRVPGSFFRTFFVWQGKVYFDIVNSLMMTALIIEIYWLSHEGKIAFRFNPSWLLWIFFCLWSFNVRYVDTCLWIAGSCDYLWLIVVVLAFLIPYIRKYFDARVFENGKKNRLVPIIFVLGIFAGWSHETTNCWIVLALLFLIRESLKRRNLQMWEIIGFTGFSLGYAFLIFAPGNFSRLQMQQNTTNFLISYELLQSKLIELAIIIVFHFFIWYYIIGFFIRYWKRKSMFLNRNTDLYLNLAKLFISIACGSGFFMTLIPSNALRISFLNLVYLIVAAAVLFRVQEINEVSFIEDWGKLFLRFVGGVYLATTICISVWGNYSNWNYWNKVVHKINESRVHFPEVMIEVDRPSTKKSDFWIIGSGLHLVPIPVLNSEEHEFNKMISIYYGIKGIKTVDTK